MNRTRHQLLARAALAQDQHRIVVLADLFNHLVHALHLRRNADQPAKARPRAQLLAQDAIFLIEFDGAHHALQLGAQFFNVKRLGHVIRRAQPRGFHGGLDRPVLRQHHHGDLRMSWRARASTAPARPAAAPSDR